MPRRSEPSATSPDRKLLFDKIATLIPEDWRPGSVDAIATTSADGSRIIIKAVNYQATPTALLVRLQGAGVPGQAVVRLHTITAGLMDTASLEHPGCDRASKPGTALCKRLQRGP